MELSISIDVRNWRKALAKIEARAIPAQVRALNRSIKSGRTRMTQLVSRDMRLKAGTVRDRIKVEEARPSTLSAALSASLKRIPLIQFGARGPEPSRGRGKGVTARTSTRRYRSAFIAKMPSGHRGVYARKRRARLPIRELFGPSIGHVFMRFRPEGERRAQEQLAKNLKHEFRFVLQQSVTR